MDVLALLDAEGNLVCPFPMTDALAEAAGEVARTLGLADPEWFNATVARNWAPRWPERLPPGLNEGVEWQTYGSLEVGLVGRAALVPLKLHAVVDRAVPRFAPSDGSTLTVDGADLGTQAAQKHLGDLLALSPTDEELASASDWVRDQDPSPHLQTVLDVVLAAVRDAR